MKRYIGCDPGKTGALVCISEDGVEIVPFEEEAYRDALERWSKDSCVAAIERVSAMPGQGVSSTFTFGQNFGYTQGLMYAFKIPVNLVSPAVWKKEFSVLRFVHPVQSNCCLAPLSRSYGTAQLCQHLN